jgi:DNA polymerase-3 subunit alpha
LFHVLSAKIRYGAFSTEKLVLAAVENGVTSLALTNINSTCNLWAFIRLCGEHHINPIADVELRNEDTFFVFTACTHFLQFVFL